MWVFWELFLFLFAASGHPKPVNDDVPLDRGRMALGIIAFILGLLSITLVPIQILCSCAGEIHADSLFLKIIR